MNKQFLTSVARHAGIFGPTSEDLAAIDEAVMAVKKGEVATDAKVEAVFAKYRHV